MSLSRVWGLQRSRSATNDSAVRRGGIADSEGRDRTRSAAEVAGVLRAGMLLDIFVFFFNF